MNEKNLRNIGRRKKKHDSEDEQGVQTEPRQSKRITVENFFGQEFLTYLLENEPQNYEEVVSSSKGLLWKETIKSEVDSILQNHT